MSADVKATIGQMIRTLREEGGLSQEKAAERAGITYQYLSAIEHGKENFTIGVLESIAAAFHLSLPGFIGRAFLDITPAPTVNKKYFVQGVPLPPLLSAMDIALSLDETHRIIRLLNTTLRSVSGRPLSAYIQGNNFSGIVSNILCDAFSRMTPYKHNHDQRYPDLMCKNIDNTNIAGLEVKSTVRPGKGGESYNGHSGWHLIACFNLDKETGDIVFIHVMLAMLNAHNDIDPDWNYLGSKVNTDTGSRRTETYITNTRGTTKLRHGTVYLDTGKVDIRRWKMCNEIAIPAWSPFGVNEKPLKLKGKT
jgi:transcriptional regulator with XRE-family HTH domain